MFRNRFREVPIDFKSDKWYRPELDLLRSIAILGVIGYHLDIGAFKYGFLGVDIFLVLSGYLIFRIITIELSNDCFSLPRFYKNRIRRIMPALLFVILATIPFAWMTLPSNLFKDFGQSVVSSSLLFSNFLFLKEIDYFNAASDEKPLLHTWSLGLEAQFYFIIPIFFLLLHRIKKNTINSLRIFFIFVALISFGLYIYFNQEESNTVFYLLPFRLWEFILGGSVALYPIRKLNICQNERFALIKFARWGGLGVLIFCMSPLLEYFFHTSEIRIICTLTTAFFILLWSDSRNENIPPVFNLLALAGQYSYSAYLWHYPIIVFIRASNFGLSKFGESLFVIFFTVTLSYVSKTFIENRFTANDRKAQIDFKIFQFLVPTVVILVIFGVISHLFNGFPTKQKEFRVDYEKLFDSEITLLGDSHLGEINDTLVRVNMGKTSNLTVGSCLPLFGLIVNTSYTDGSQCVSNVNGFLRQVSNGQKSGILLIGSMVPVYLDKTTFNGQNTNRIEGLVLKDPQGNLVNNPWEAYEQSLLATFSILSRAENLNSIFVMDYPELGIEQGCNVLNKEIRFLGLVLRDLISPISKSDCKVRRIDFENRSRQYFDIVTRVSKKFPTINIFIPSRFFCDNYYCYGFNHKFGFLYSDSDHLTNNGSYFYLINLKKFMDEKGIS